MWPRPTRVFRSSKAPRGGLADPGQAGHDAGADPALGDRVFALPEQRLRSSIGWNSVPLKAKIGFFDLSGGALGNGLSAQMAS